jgi:putative phosphoesterase
MLIGLISDTHGLFRPSVRQALAGVDLILHAGDVGGASVLASLKQIAPVRAVAGNVDDPNDPSLESQFEVPVEKLRVHVSHGHEVGSPTPAKLLARYTADILVYGHTHRAVVHRAGARIAINPGAAGPRRFNIKPSLALMRIDGGNVAVDIVRLDF